MLEAYAAHVLRTLRMSCALCLFAVQLFRFFVAHVFGICRFVLPIASVRCASVVRVLYVCCMFVVHIAVHIVCNYCVFGPPMLCMCCPALHAYVVYVVFLLRIRCCVLRAYVQCSFLRVCCVCVAVCECIAYNISSIKP